MPQVQDAYQTAGATPALGAELTVLDVLGYTPATTTTSGGTWTKLTNQPSSPVGTMLLLPNGTVMAQGGARGAVTNIWYQLTPDSSGSYDNGTWSNLASMNTQRLYYGSAVLPSGDIMVYGGEYSGSLGTRTLLSAGEIYDPAANSWTVVPSIPSSLGDTQNVFGDGSLEVLAGGDVLAGFKDGPQTFLYNPSTNSWSAGGTKLDSDSSDEETWVKLPNGDILQLDPSNSQDVQVLQDGTTLLGEFALSSFTGIYLNGNGTFSENFGNGSFGPIYTPLPVPLAPSGTIAASSGYDLPTFLWSSVTPAGSDNSFFLYDDTANQALGGIVRVAGTSWTPSTALTPGHTCRPQCRPARAAQSRPPPASIWWIFAVSTNGQDAAYFTNGLTFQIT